MEHYTDYNPKLVLFSLLMSVLSHLTPAFMASVASIIGIIAGSMAIINYCILWYERYKNKKRN